MKKLFALAILLGAGLLTVSSASAQSYNYTADNNNYQYQQRRVYRRYDRVVRVVTQVRTVRVGRRVFRDTYQTRYFASGRTQSRRISRVRVR